MQNTNSIPGSQAAKTPSIWPFFVLGLLMIALFVGVNQWLVGGSTANTEPEEAARNELRIKNLAELRAENEKYLSSYAWIDRTKGAVQIPIDAAMALVIPQLNAGAPRPAYPVVAPPAPPAPAAPAPTPAAPTPAAPTPAAPTPAAPTP